MTKAGSVRETHAAIAPMRRREAVRLYGQAEDHAERDNCEAALGLLIDAARMHGGYVTHAAEAGSRIDTLNLELVRAQSAIVGCFTRAGYREP